MNILKDFAKQRDSITHIEDMYEVDNIYNSIHFIAVSISLRGIMEEVDMNEFELVRMIDYEDTGYSHWNLYYLKENRLFMLIDECIN